MVSTPRPAHCCGDCGSGDEPAGGDHDDGLALPAQLVDVLQHGSPGADVAEREAARRGRADAQRRRVEHKPGQAGVVKNFAVQRAIGNQKRRLRRAVPLLGEACDRFGNGHVGEDMAARAAAGEEHMNARFVNHRRLPPDPRKFFSIASWRNFRRQHRRALYRRRGLRGRLQGSGRAGAMAFSRTAAACGVRPKA